MSNEPQKVFCYTEESMAKLQADYAKVVQRFRDGDHNALNYTPAQRNALLMLLGDECEFEVPIGGR